jgi:hypothetical protein
MHNPTQKCRPVIGISKRVNIPDDGDVYLDKLQKRGVKKSILYM